MAEPATQIEPTEPAATPTATPEPSTSPAPEPAAEPSTPQPASPAEPLGLADPTALPDLPQATPATWPEDWRERFAASDEDDLKTLKRFQSPEGFWKSYRNMRSKMGTEYYRKMPDSEDEEVLANWRKEAGVPEAPEGYLESLPRELQVTDEDRPFLDDYFARMHKRGISPADVVEGVTAYYEMRAQESEATLEEDRTARAVVEDELRAEWGPEYRGNLNGMHALFDAYGNEDLMTTFFEARTPGGRPLGDEPGVLKFLVALAKEINPGGTVVPVAGQGMDQTLKDEITGLEAEMHVTRSADPMHYINNPQKQERLRELYRMEEKLALRR